MIGSKIEELPEDLQTVAKRISTTAECKCDLSVGFICESCVIYALMINAAKEIVKLRGEASEKRKTDRERIVGLPIAHRTSMTYVGRNIYIIEGAKGLYWLRKRLQDEKLPKVSARRQSTRGCSWAESVFVRGKELEELLKPALCE
ncbi:MAG: hypothetical protein WC919_02010 [Candidatus Paceibacterota bacterium]|jgi:hypothetical protein